MTSTTSTMTFTPQHSSPLARTRSPFKNPRPPPCTPAKTAKLWDEFEKTALENARRREQSLPSSQPQRCSASDILHSSTATVTTARSSFDFKFRSRQTTSTSATVAICKTCKQPITYSSGVCEACKKTIIVSLPTSGATPVVSPSTKEFGPADLQRVHRQSPHQEANMPKATSPKCRSFCPLPTQLFDPPIRLSSLRPPLGKEPAQPARSRKVSLTDPNEPFLRIQIAPTASSRSASIPSTPTYPPTTTPPSTTQSRSSTRPSSISNIIAPLSPVAVHIPTHPYARHNSATPSDMSTLIPCASITTTSRPSVGSTAYSVTHTTSAWDDWDSDEEGERAGLVGYWRGIGKGQGRKGSSDSKISFESMSAKLSSAREEERKKSREQRRGSKEKEQRPRSSESENGKKKKGPRGFVRVISCGGCSVD